MNEKWRSEVLGRKNVWTPKCDGRICADACVAIYLSVSGHVWCALFLCMCVLCLIWVSACCLLLLVLGINYTVILAIDIAKTNHKPAIIVIVSAIRFGALKGILCILYYLVYIMFDIMLPCVVFIPQDNSTGPSSMQLAVLFCKSQLAVSLVFFSELSKLEIVFLDYW